MRETDQPSPILALIGLLCERLREWSEGRGEYPIGDIDKAASTLKKLQEVYSMEQGYAPPEGDGGIIVTHHIPRGEPSEEKAE